MLVIFKVVFLSFSYYDALSVVKTLIQYNYEILKYMGGEGYSYHLTSHCLSAGPGFEENVHSNSMLFVTVLVSQFQKV